MESKRKFKPDTWLKLMDQVRQVLRYYRRAYRTEQTYCDWIVRFIKFHGSKRHPKDMGKGEVEGFLSHLASKGKVSASTQRQALNAIVFLHREVLDQPIQGEIAPVRANRHAKVPVVMSQGEVQRALREMIGTPLLTAKLLYGGGKKGKGNEEDGLSQAWGGHLEHRESLHGPGGRGAQRKGNGGGRGGSIQEAGMEFVPTKWYRSCLKYRTKEGIP